jgi:predicted nucleotidyltransferase
MKNRELALQRICERFRLQILYVFGSRAEQARKWLFGELDGLEPGPSDVDVGVKTSEREELTVENKVNLALALEDFFGAYPVDLVSLNDADPFLAANIIRGERLFAQDEYLADEYDLFVLRRAGDLAPLERERLALILGEQH